MVQGFPRLAMRSFCTLAASLCLLAASASAQADPGTVRVRLLAGAGVSEVGVSAVGVSGTLRLDGTWAATLEPTSRITLSRSGNEVRVQAGGREYRGREATVDAAEIRVWAGRVDRRYPGRLAVRVEGGALELVNHAPVEPYVASVVASELGFPELEAAKAQAVLARTYAARRRGQQPGYDLDDDQGSQVYHGLATSRPRRSAPPRRRPARSSPTAARSPRPPTSRRRAGTRPTTSRSGAAPRSPTSAACRTPTTTRRRTTSGARRPHARPSCARSRPASAAAWSASRWPSARPRAACSGCGWSGGGPRPSRAASSARPSTPPWGRARSGARGSTSRPRATGWCSPAAASATASG